MTSKVLSDTVANSSSIIREIKSLDKLFRCDYICNYIGVSSIDGDLALVMEYIDNYSLYEWLHTFPNHMEDPKSLTNPQIREIQLGIARGLEYMHNQKIAHNDVKSANIMLDSQFNPKLIDFGMVKIISTTTRSSGNSSKKQLGTDYWRAPEYWKYNEEVADTRAKYPYAGDVFSFGTVLGEMATGKIPWEGLTSKIIEDSIFKGMRPYYEHQLESSLFKIIEGAWQQEPKDRLGINEVLGQLEKILKTD
eukprot:NODE_729_length_4379_cov_1.289486.p3 type:complete len:250 gc:universal NODE_729_length_4379_cov_1.289486:1-750(+)